ncbi:hypothetical protein V1506DRAFT_540040 [Lipomyces tetrasporus]
MSSTPLRFSSLDVFQPPPNSSHSGGAVTKPSPMLQFTYSPSKRPSSGSTYSEVDSNASRLSQISSPTSLSPSSMLGPESPSHPAPRRQSSVKLQQVPPQILLPFVDRPSEMDSLMTYNESFFSLLKGSVGDDVYGKQLLPLFRSPRDKLDDIAFLLSIKRILCAGGESSSRMWIEFCRIVGCDDHELLSPYTPSAAFSRLPPSLDGAAETNDEVEKVQFRNQNPFTSHRREYSESTGGVSPTFTFHDPIIEED